MSPELSIKLDFLKNRRNPAEVFEAMALYIKAYEGFGQLLASSAGIKGDFRLQLNKVENGSILSKLTALPGQINHLWQETLFNSGKKLFDEMHENNETRSEEQVEHLAADLEETLVGNTEGLVIDPCIDRNSLAYVLSKFSKANEKTEPGENVSMAINDDEHSRYNINTAWRFTGNIQEMFKGTTLKQQNRDHLYVTVSVNEGNSVWSFRSMSLRQKFTARIIHKEMAKQLSKWTYSGYWSKRCY